LPTIKNIRNVLTKGYKTYQNDSELNFILLYPGASRECFGGQRGEMKKIILWTLAGAALTAALIYGTMQLLNSVSTTMPAEMPLMRGDG
jgi:hypothetical protein